MFDQKQSIGQANEQAANQFLGSMLQVQNADLMSKKVNAEITLQGQQLEVAKSKQAANSMEAQVNLMNAMTNMGAKMTFDPEKLKTWDGSTPLTSILSNIEMNPTGGKYTHQQGDIAARTSAAKELQQVKGQQQSSLEAQRYQDHMTALHAQLDAMKQRTDITDETKINIANLQATMKSAEFGITPTQASKASVAAGLMGNPASIPTNTEVQSGAWPFQKKLGYDDLQTLVKNPSPEDIGEIKSFVDAIGQAKTAGQKVKMIEYFKKNNPKLQAAVDQLMK